MVESFPVDKLKNRLLGLRTFGTFVETLFDHCEIGPNQYGANSNQHLLDYVYVVTDVLTSWLFVTHTQPPSPPARA